MRSVLCGWLAFAAVAGSAAAAADGPVVDSPESVFCEFKAALKAKDGEGAWELLSADARALYEPIARGLIESARSHPEKFKSTLELLGIGEAEAKALTGKIAFVAWVRKFDYESRLGLVLENVRIDGDRATAAGRPIGGAIDGDTYAFVREDGRWRIDVAGLELPAALAAAEFAGGQVAGEIAELPDFRAAGQPLSVELGTLRNDTRMPAGDFDRIVRRLRLPLLKDKALGDNVRVADGGEKKPADPKGRPDPKRTYVLTGEFYEAIRRGQRQFEARFKLTNSDSGQVVLDYAQEFSAIPPGLPWNPPREIPAPTDAELNAAKAAFKDRGWEYSTWTTDGQTTRVFSRKDATDTDLKGLPDPPFAYLLCLDGAKVTDAGPTHLRGLRNLTGLVLSRTKVTDAGLARLRDCRALVRLDLNDTAVTDAGLKELASLGNLEHLALDRTKVTEAGLARLAPLKGLTSLHLDRLLLTDAGLARLRGLKYLAALDLSEADVTDAGLAEVGRFTRLRTLDLSLTAVTDAGLRHLAGLQSLTELDLRVTQVSDAGLKAIGKLAGLRSLRIGHTQVIGSGFGDLGQLPKFVELDISGGPLPDTVLQNLHRIKGLKAVYLGYAEVTDAGLRDIAKLKGLEFLDLNGSKVTDAGLKELRGLDQLFYLDLSESAVTDAGLKELHQLKSLTSVHLAGTPVTAAGAAELKKALPKCEITR